MKNLESNLSIAVLAIAALSIGGIVAPAASAQEPVQFEFSYSAEELQTEAGKHNVMERIEAGAKRACSMSSQRLTLLNQRLQNECVTIAMDDAVKSIQASQQLAQRQAIKSSS
ncbi:UrcA family protein [Hirschia baltica]|uniref:UrcA family protein n=1 Tax=Hirschia baltica (strain ATCC 49814 / DSM 5838 / IFAM 1418) TaxID=582402 RepID=C6XQJ6_HIRBI|nr:UrcA family protein [Hirschia baltica]ACT58602.1 hypothetical protein Hbal_0908 [Hirschia baltica ATCC 49814]